MPLRPTKVKKLLSHAYKETNVDKTTRDGCFEAALYAGALNEMYLHCELHDEDNHFEISPRLNMGFNAFNDSEDDITDDEPGSASGSDVEYKTGSDHSWHGTDDDEIFDHESEDFWDVISARESSADDSD